ncbi:nucleotidyltransferase domain-containing protein [Parasulfitobacter algicola]|uniref:Amino acid transporter n=1 Tax=Parasulfitobacter algicola TaxID=2614809 RepID=A0ABX2IWJ1_9RHOB|nr:amino acid transporter [Sulfitobacter algicola]NSX56426.1 amino acid transporter [Sulfitobacter algicola]
MTPPDENAWDAWSPGQLAGKLSGLTANWYIVGGWAIDLWLGEQSRAHEDLEFATLPEDAPKIASHLAELTFYEARAGQFKNWDQSNPVDNNAWQFWGADLSAGRWRVDMMLERGTPELWRYKRQPLLEQSRNTAIQINSDGIRYLAPANVLLFKAKHCRAKDDHDFEAVLPTLLVNDRENLRAWLTSYHPSHKWLKRLT